jgi:hypothetical protein
MLLCANFFPIPYYVFVSITLLQCFSFELTSVLTLVTGVVLGSSIVFYFYINFSKMNQNGLPTETWTKLSAVLRVIDFCDYFV